MGNDASTAKPNKPKKNKKKKKNSKKKIKKKPNAAAPNAPNTNSANNPNTSNTAVVDPNNPNAVAVDPNNPNAVVNGNSTTNPATTTATASSGTGLGAINENLTTNGGLGFAMHKRMTINDFTFLKVVGKGSFGKVMQVRKNDDNKIYALKVLKKKELVKRKQVVHTQTERRVLSGIDNPFIVALRYSFQSDAKLYMVLDFFNGGELFFHLKNEGRFSQKRSKFYSGEICLALSCLHSAGIIYRDLKPENVLLDCDGHIKITDFGLSKDSLKGDMITHTFCGTPEYLAPEVLHQQGHGKAVDWWSFGTLLYEMMTGLPPFYNENLNIMYEKILHAPIPLPKYLSKEARSIFLGLLERDPKRRLGSSANDATEIKTHPFYKDIDWDKLLKKEIKPPFKPKVKDQNDVSNVDEEFTEEVPKDTLVDKTGSMLAAKDMFVGFTYDQNTNALQ